MNRPADGARKGPGRPSKYGRPSRVIAVTLPEDVIDRLRHVHRDLGWAIVKLLDTSARPGRKRQEEQADVELVTIAERRSLIVVNREIIGSLPGVHIVPLYGNRAFLALDIHRGMSDLELSVMDRLAQPRLEARERRALLTLRAKLSTWRRDQGLLVHTKAIVVIERPGSASARRADVRRTAMKRRTGQMPGRGRQDDAAVAD